MILRDFLFALAQFTDPRFRAVLWRGLGLTLALLVVVFLGFVGLIDLVTPASFTLPWIGTVSSLHAALSWASLLLMIGLSVFLMVPVAAAFIGVFLDEVSQAVEDRHYPGLRPARVQSWDEILRDSLGFFLLLIAVNAVALLTYVFAGPLVPLIFWAVNGYLLGREYFQMVALRRLSPSEAQALRARYQVRIWLAGVLMAAPLSIPLLNLVVPILGAATFTHLFHRLARPG